jgi:large conductance mechanosensitive channel
MRHNDFFGVTAGLLANLVVVVHLLFIALAALGGLLALRWRGMPWLHLPAAGWGTFVEMSGGVCPLTPLEASLRRAAGRPGYEGDFIDRYLTLIIYPAGLTQDVQIALGTSLIAVNVVIYAFVWGRRPPVKEGHMLKEFKDFAMRGNVVDMAVGIIIGVAFGAIVTSFVGDVPMPIIGLFLGGADFSNQFLLLKDGTMPGPYASLEAAKAAGAVVVAYGVLLNTVVNFLIVAFALFLVVKGMNATRKQQAEAPSPPAVASKEALLLTEIRDLLARR